MKSKFDNRPLSLSQKLLKEIVIVIGGVILLQIIFNAYEDFERLKQEALAGDCLVLKITKDKGKVIYVAGIYRGGSESDLSSYDIRDTFLVPEKAFQFRVKENDAISHNNFIKTFITKGRINFPRIIP